MIWSGCWKVAVIHGGPIEAQERFIARTVRVLAEQH